MTLRKPLAVGTEIQLSQDNAARTYRIERVIGEGATCIVYEAERIGAVRSPRCRIKECYPLHTQTERIGDIISWRVPIEREMAYKRMRKAHDLMVSLRDDETVGNHIPTTELFEGNGTLYSVMEINHADTKTIDQLDNMEGLLEVIRVLSEVVACVHENGFLHLDLKPDNFLARVYPSAAIWLFDVDSFEAITNIREKKVGGLSFTRGYAAPEQRSAELERVSEKSDIYAIGAILFEKIMGRLPDALDRGSFPEWEFDSPLFTNINPIIKVRIAEFFKKTLALKPEKRYESAHELAEALKVTRDLVKEPYLLSNIPTSVQSFVGRKEELQVINSALQRRIVILQGVGGIGKSELVKQYAKMHCQDYQTVIFSRFEGTVEQTLDSVPIHNYCCGEAEKKETLRRLLNENTLWVIDGFDTKEVGDIHLLEELACRIIITSRRAWDEYASFAPVIVESLPIQEQIYVFETELGHNLLTYEKQDVKEILHYIDGHTLLIPLLAKQLKKGYFGLKDILHDLRDGGIKGTSVGVVKHIKDGVELSGPVNQILYKLFDVAQFGEQEKCVFAIIVLCKHFLIEQSKLVEWIGDQSITVLDELISLGWLRREQCDQRTYIVMHSVLIEIVSDLLSITVEMCSGFKEYIERIATQVDEKYKIPVVEWHSDGECLAETVLDYEDDAKCESAIMLLADIMKGDTWRKPNDVHFWLRISRKLVSVLYGDRKALSAIGISIERLITSGESLPKDCRANALLTLETIALRQRKPSVAASYVRELCKQSEDEHYEKEATLFDACFALYQYLCADPFGEDGRRKLFGMQQFAADVNTIFVNLLAHWCGKDSFANIEGKRSRLSKKVVQQLQRDFCIRAFGRNHNLDIQENEDGLWFPELVEDSAWYKDEVEAIDNPKQIKITNNTNELQDYLSKTQNGLQIVVETLIAACDDSLLFSVPRQLTEDEYQKVVSGLQSVDIKLESQWEFLLEDEKIQNCLLKTEVEFMQAYARLEEWDAYNFHSLNLLNYYEGVVQKFICLGDTSINTINELLPMYRELMTNKEMQLPRRKALDFLDDLVQRMEVWLRNHPSRNDLLLELYKSGCHQAYAIKDGEKLQFYLERYHTACLPELLEKEEYKKRQELLEIRKEPSEII